MSGQSYARRAVPCCAVLRGAAGAGALGLVAAAGANATAQLNVHSIAIQVPVSQLTRGKHGAVTDPGSVIGVWTSASRQRASVWDPADGQQVWSGPFYQVSRLANPLVNEVLIPLGRKVPYSGFDTPS